MKIKEIPIDKIKIYQNIRSKQKDVANLMKSIEHEGLLHPIGVYEKDDFYTLAYGWRRLQAAIKLNWKVIPAVILPDKFTEEDFLTKNTIENIHREEINPIELGRVCRLFTKKGFTRSEIATKLHIVEARVKTTMYMYDRLPEEYRDLIGFIPRGQHNKGKIPMHVATVIIKLRLSKPQMKKLLEYAKVHEMTTNQVFLIEKLMRTGLSFEKVIANIDRYAIKNIYLSVIKKEVERLNLATDFTEYIKEIIRGDKPPNKNLLI